MTKCRRELRYRIQSADINHKIKTKTSKIIDPHKLIVYSNLHVMRKIIKYFAMNNRI
jgi:hypothetical protein